jgi:hypothetical protein
MLKTSILASQLSIFPPGLGELIFEDGANPLSGRTILQISSRADTLLTDWPLRGPEQYQNLDSTLRMLNASFEGPLDTISFSSTLRFRGTRPLSSVPYLRANPGSVPYVVDWTPGAAEETPVRFALLQNYPNPFNPLTTIGFELPEPAMVTLRVYDILGAEVGTVLDREELAEGLQEIDFEAGTLPSGVYFYRITVETLENEEGQPGGVLTETGKMVLMK